MRGYPQFSFWIPIALAKICFFPHSHKPRKNTSVLVGTVFNVTRNGILLHIQRFPTEKSTTTRFKVKL